MTGVGHNSTAANQLRAYIERIESVETDIAHRQDDRKQIYAEAKATGFDTKIIRKIVRIRATDRDKVVEEQALLDTYLHALGEELPQTELFELDEQLRRPSADEG